MDIFHIYWFIRKFPLDSAVPLWYPGSLCISIGGWNDELRWTDILKMGTENNLFALRYVYIYIYYQLVWANYSISWIGKSRMRLLSHPLVLAIGVWPLAVPQRRLRKSWQRGFHDHRHLTDGPKLKEFLTTSWPQKKNGDFQVSNCKKWRFVAGIYLDRYH